MEYFVYFTMEEGAPMSPPSSEGMAEMQQMMMDGMSSGLIVSTGQLASETTHVRLEKGEVSSQVVVPQLDGAYLHRQER